MSQRVRLLMGFLLVCLPLTTQAGTREADGVSIELLAGGMQRLWFARKSFYVDMPASWETKPPTPSMRARVERDPEGAFPLTCQWAVLDSSNFRESRAKDLLAGKLSPESQLEGLDDGRVYSDVKLLRTERVTVAGRPASHFVYTATYTVEGVSAPLEMSALTVPFNGTIFISHCGTGAADFPDFEGEITSIQQSLRQNREP